MSVQFAVFEASQSESVCQLFTEVFSDSEGAEEGAQIGKLVSDLIAGTAADDLLGCVAADGGVVLAALFFSRLTLANEQSAFLMSPVAVATRAQRQGIGQRLIQFGLEQLAAQSVELVFTYGDPAYYGQTGFRRISQEEIAAPWPLSQPVGWLAQTLDGTPVPVIRGETRCVTAFNDPALW